MSVMDKKHLSLAKLIKHGLVLPNGTVQMKPGTDPEPALDLSGVTVNGGTAQTVQASQTITLPDGPFVTVTGTDRIATIEARDGSTVFMRFESAGCMVLSGAGNVFSPVGDYVSQPNGVLYLLCQGGTWYEISRSHPNILDVWFYNTSSQSIPDNTGTNVQWTDNGYFFFPKDTLGLLFDDPSTDATVPKTNVAVKLPYRGVYDVFWQITFQKPNPDAGAGRRRGSLSMFFTGGTPDGTSTDQWAAIGDGNEVPPPASSGYECTIVGSTTLYSTGVEYIKLTCDQTQGKALTISQEAYETALHISYRGH